MIIIDKPYVSEFLVDSIVQNDWEVLENETIKLSNIEEGAFTTLSTKEAVEHYDPMRYPIIYSNSENSIDWVLENLPETELSRYIKIFKDKVEFRENLKNIFPDFYYRSVNYEDLKKINLDELKYPLVLKPAIGFLSLGVHTINNDDEWKKALFALEAEMQAAQKLYPQSVVDASKFIIEEYVDGEEFAIDAYFDKNGQPVILNIFQHPLLNSQDVRDRIYLMSVGIMVKYMAKFAMVLKQIGDAFDVRNFPFHIELRVTNEEKIIPIEINPMRFSGWCTADVAEYAWGINVYEYFMEQKKPDWNSILSEASRGVYYFSMAEVPNGVDRARIKSFDYEKYLSNFSKVLEVRRINPRNNPLFAVVFGQTNDKEEIKRILQLKTKDYLILS